MTNNQIDDNTSRWPQAFRNNFNLRSDDEKVNCTTLINPTNATIVFADGWQAIPETILFNLILFSFFLIIFVIFRHLAWDRKHLNIRRTSKGWLQSIYGDRKLATKSLINRENSPIIHHKHDIQISILMPPNNGFGNVRNRIPQIGSVVSDTNDTALNTSHSHHNINNANITINRETENNTVEDVVIEEEPQSTSVRLNLPTADEDASSNRSIPSITYNGDNNTNSNNNVTIHQPAHQNQADEQPSRPITTTTTSPSTGTDGVLGSSFDFANIPTNIQATFTEVGYRLSDVLLISNNDILKSRGNDALQYVLFQQHIIYFMAILCVFCMLVVLPVNYQGDQFGPSEGFARTTVINLPENSPFYWVHVIGASIISLIGMIMMHRFSKVIKIVDERITRRTLLIRRVPKKKRNKELIANYFQKAVPNCVIEGIQSVYDVRRLTPLTNELTNLVNARCYCIEYLELKGERLQIRPAALGEFGCLCGCCNRCKKVDGIKFYTQAEEDLQRLITAEMTKSLSHSTGGFFITFQTERMAQEAYNHLKQKQERAFAFCPFSGTTRQIISWVKSVLKIPESNDLSVGRWLFSFAPYPDDINWCDLTVNLRMRWLRSIIVNLLLLAVFVFISTPTVIWNATDSLNISELIGSLQYFLPSEIGSKVPELVSTLVLVIAASILPAIVTLACQYIPYVNNSARNHAIMWKVYLYLVLMVIIWPSLGITSLKYFIIMMIKKGDFPWNCLFPVKLGAFFVNYTIQYAFLGNIMELMRIPELLIYLWYMATARSRAEVDTASRYVVWDFSIGIRYPRFLLIFAMVVTYSLSCPLITVAGLIYMLIKHLIDRYNIYYVYNPSKINSKIHSTAIIFVHIAFLMMQAQIFTVTLVRTGYSRVFKLALFVFLVSLLIFSGPFFFYMFKNINHLTYRTNRKQSTKARREYCACAYLPPVLYNLTRYTLNKSPSAATIMGAGGYDNGGNGAGINPAGGSNQSHTGGDAHGSSNVGGSSVAGIGSGNVVAFHINGDSIGSSQNLLAPTIDTSDAYFLSGSNGNGNMRPKFSHHSTMLSTRKHDKKSRRTASDGQQQFHQSRFVQYEALQLQRTSSDLENLK